MKKHSLFKVVMISIALVMLLSWVVPAIYYSNYSGWVGTTTEAAKVEIGLLEVVNNFFAAVWNFADIGIFILVIGGLYGVLHKISGYRNLLDSVANGFKNREWLFLVIVTILFSILSSMAGLSIPLLALVPFVVSVVLLMGYDKITAAMVTIGGIIVGLMGSVFSSKNTEAIEQMLSTSADKDVLFKVLLLGLGLVLLLFNIIMYSRKHKSNKTNSNSYIPEKTSKSEKKWPIVVVLDITLIILILGFISWGLFAGEGGITWASKALDSMNEFSVFGVKVFEVLFGFTNAFGNWTLIEASFVLVTASCLLAFIYKMSFNDYITNFMNGAKRALKPAVLVIMSYVIMMLSSNIWCSLAKPFFELTGNINVFTMIIVALIISLVSGSLSNGAYLVLAYFLFFILEVSNASSLAASDITLISLIWQSMNGIMMLVAPTSVVMLAILSYLHIPYGRWLKSIWLLFFELLAVVSITLTVISITI